MDLSSKTLATEPIAVTSKVTAQQVLEGVEYVLVDCDGVIYLGDNPIPGAIGAIDYFRKSGRQVIFATNNSSKTRAGFAEKLTKLGFQTKPEEVMTTSYAAAVYLKSKKFNKKIYMMGDVGLRDELTAAGFDHTGYGPDPVTETWQQGHIPFKPDYQVGAMVVGFDRDISFPKITKAMTYANLPGNLFIATNTDETYPNQGSDVTVPGAGACVRAVQTGVGREPDVILGKPNSHFLECIQMVYPSLRSEKCLMVGDRITTDIAFGTNCGMKTLFVETGASTMKDVRRSLKSSDPEVRLGIPHYIAKSLGFFTSLLH